jgi:hypothetical protein
MPPKPRKHKQTRSERLLAESEAAHGYLSFAMEARNDLIVSVNVEKAFQSFRIISRGISRGRLDPTLQNQILAAQKGLQERLYNVVCAIQDP